MADKDEGLQEDRPDQVLGGEGHSGEVCPPPQATINKKGKKGKKCNKPDIDPVVTQAVNSTFQNHLQDIINARDKRSKRKRHSSDSSSISDSLGSDSSPVPHSS